MNNRGIREILDDLVPLASAIGVIGITTSYEMLDTGASRRRMSLERHGKKQIYYLLSQRDGRRHAIKMLMATLGLDEAVATRFLELGDELAERNDVGSWCLAPDKAEPMIATGAGISGLTAAERRMCAGKVHRVFKGARVFSRVDVSLSFRTNPNGKESRKLWLSFLDSAGVELAAIGLYDALRLFRELEDAPVVRRSELELLSFRWAQQLRMSPKEFRAVLIELAVLQSKFRVTSVTDADCDGRVQRVTPA